MSKLVHSVQIMSVADLYTQYSRFARSYDLCDNPLRELTLRIPLSADFYAIAPVGDSVMTEVIMKKLAGRRKLRKVYATKDEIRHAAFAPTNQMVIMFA